MLSAQNQFVSLSIHNNEGKKENANDEKKKRQLRRII